jgi:hypothetical protein
MMVLFTKSLPVYSDSLVILKWDRRTDRIENTHFPSEKVDKYQWGSLFSQWKSYIFASDRGKPI